MGAAHEVFQWGQGPPEYWDALKECRELSERIDRMIFPEILHRYRLDWVAEIYEQDRATFDIMREVGRRWVRRNQKRNAFRLERDRGAADHILKNHGPDALEKLSRRLIALGLPPA